jgi:hypothetical protein
MPVVREETWTVADETRRGLHYATVKKVIKGKSVLGDAEVV